MKNKEFVMVFNRKTKNTHTKNVNAGKPNEYLTTEDL